MEIEKINDLIRKHQCKVRLLHVNGTLSGWWQFIVIPSLGYWEGTNGPFRKTQIKNIEIDAMVKITPGRLIPEKTVNYTNEIVDVLTKHNIPFELNSNIIVISASFFY